MTEILGVIVGLTLFAGYAVYYKTVRDGVRPNTTLWTLWTFGSLLELASYMVVTGDWVKNILPAVCAITCIALYIHFLFKGKFQKLTRENMLIIAADVTAMLLWWFTESALVANIAMQVSTIISFVPMYKEVFDEDENEKQLPWIIWSVTYFLDIILVFARWEKWGDLAYPVTNFVLHFLMWVLIFARFKWRGSDPRHTRFGEIEKHLYVAESSVAGMGLFTSRKILAGEEAFVLKGEKIHFSPTTREESLQFPNIFGLDNGVSIDPIFPYDHINHRCEPNLATEEDGVTFVALRDIEVGEELTFDYSISEHSLWEMECACGSNRCRKTIRSIESLPREFYVQYYPHIPSYFQRVYINNHILHNK